MIASGLSLSGTSNATLISATETPGPRTLLEVPRLLMELPMLSDILLNAKAAKRKKPAKKKMPPKEGPVDTITPGREYPHEKGE
jgi:hypothetical protein